ncbi:MAG: MFS transporter [Gemmatimonadaceae bacterium]|nr:MFS transporter [Gemmatimonadaceae bacterium]
MTASTAPVAPAASDTTSAPPRFDRPSVLRLMLGHGATDFYQAAVPALVPYFVATFHLTLARGASAVFAATILSAVLQPFFGWLADRRATPWLTTWGLVLAAGGVAAAVMAPNYTLALLAVGLAGIGVAAFHPEATRAVNMFSGDRKGTGMSFFTIGGNIGFALAPIIVVPLATPAYRGGLAALCLLSIPCAWILNRAMGALPTARGKAARNAAHDRTLPSDAWGAFALLGVAIGMRSMMVVAMNTFLPTYWSQALHTSLQTGAFALTMLLTIGLAGVFVGGRMADRIGARAVILWSFAAVAPAFWLLARAQTVLQASLALPLLAFALFAPGGVMVVLGQAYLPRHLGTASGVTVGLAVTFGGLAAPLLGRIADLHGLHTMLLLLAACAPVMALTAWLLPDRRHA